MAASHPALALADVERGRRIPDRRMAGPQRRRTVAGRHHPPSPGPAAGHHPPAPGPAAARAGYWVQRIVLRGATWFCGLGALCLAITPVIASAPPVPTLVAVTIGLGTPFAVFARLQAQAERLGDPEAQDTVRLHVWAFLVVWSILGGLMLLVPENTTARPPGVPPNMLITGLGGLASFGVIASILACATALARARRSGAPHHTDSTGSTSTAPAPTPPPAPSTPRPRNPPRRSATSSSPALTRPEPTPPT
ncbi:hypothetical protein Ae717Ps2_6244c [Pseudonocardia sp. Ae717_Ps2]|uniref:hypothetical protein n=1 Tax=Pseudonocardia sp. Ae717_Ps2 TaxID=1885573 RepID=UPI00094B4F42|nr:hypothetical protein [Pseudonocardia sp. Ae717_Ps2]OLM28648.1 hypothetical protein Ae717Ps2_6244c [Pseudonocardia sp. Ae717_Ps2]